MIDQRVAVCRDHAKDACKRQQCKYYHIPVVVPPAHIVVNMIRNNCSGTSGVSFNTTTPSSNDNNNSLKNIYSISTIPATIFNTSTLINTATVNTTTITNKDGGTR